MLGANLSICTLAAQVTGGITASIGFGNVTTGTELAVTISGTVGGETITYQWTDDGVNISGATASTYTPTIGTDNIADTSAIRCAITIDGDAYKSNTRTVVYPPPAAFTINQWSLTAV